ncbi:MAG TPA: sulfur carrier protein ThiS [Acidimicrobiales bacterium]|jgi:sulfur carrier protein
MTTVTVNGQTEDVGEGTTVADLVARHRPSPRGVAVARNEEVVPRSQWDTTAAAEGDRFEILTAAQGG